MPAPGHLTLDIGCGEGRLARDLTSLGHHVSGVDASPTMIAAAPTMIAAARTASPEIQFQVADAAALPFSDHSADLAIAFMSLQDFDDLEGALVEVGRVLAPGGRLVMAIVHPLNSAGLFDSRDSDSPFTIRGSYLLESRHVDEAERDGLRVRLASVHRPLQAYVAAIARAGLLVERLREPPVPDSAIRFQRARRYQRIPLFLHLRAIRV